MMCMAFECSLTFQPIKRFCFSFFFFFDFLRASIKSLIYHLPMTVLCLWRHWVCVFVYVGWGEGGGASS